MNIMKSGEVNRGRAMFMASMLSAMITIPSTIVIEDVAQIRNEYIEYVQSYDDELALRKQYRAEREEEDKQYENIATEAYEKVKYEQEEAERMKDYTYRTTKELRQKTGLNVVGFQEYTFELSFYSDLNIENGYGNLTANGETLSAGMIANNFLPFNTNVYIEGYGTKRVTDRGSEKYFNAVNKADVFIPRNSGESDSEYYRRVNNMGRKYVKGYILELGEE